MRLRQLPTSRQKRATGTSEFINVLINNERTIGYEAQRNGTKSGPISHCLRTESYFSLRRKTGVISRSCSNVWPRRERVGLRARTGFLQAHGRPSFLQRPFHRLIPIRSGSICEPCSFGFKKITRELALPTFVGWRGFSDAMILSRLANGRWSLVRRNRGCRPKGESGRELAAILRWRIRIRYGLSPLMILQSTPHSESRILTMIGRGSALA